MAAKVYRPVKKVERPRPLRQGSEVSATNNNNNNIVNNNNNINSTTNNVELSRISPEELLGLMEQVDGHLTNQGPLDSSVEEHIEKIHRQLPRLGPEMERLFPDHLEHYFTTYRQEVRDFQHVTSHHAMLRLLELIELRAAQWSHNLDTDNFYQHYLEQAIVQPSNLNHQVQQTLPAVSAASPPAVALLVSQQPSPTGGDVIQSSGKYPKPTKIPGKNYFKDEVVIRNADSGKVTSGAKDRLVQITGNNEDSIGNAKLLIEDTIRRNASPDRDKPLLSSQEASPPLPLPISPREAEESSGGGGGSRLMHSLSMGDASRLTETLDTLQVGGHILQVSCSSPALVEEAMAVLEAHFCSQQPTWLTGAGDGGSNCFIKCTKLEAPQNNFFDLRNKESISHTREFLLQCSQSPLASLPPSDWPRIKASHPAIVRNPPGKFDAQTFLCRPRKSGHPRPPEI